MSEKKLYQYFKKHWQNYIERIEPKNESGIPDLLLLNWTKTVLFVELKYLEKPFKESVLPIKKTQFSWHHKYSSSGGKNGFFLFQVKNSYYIFRSEDISCLKGKISWQVFNKLSFYMSKDMYDIVDFLD